MIECSANRTLTTETIGTATIYGVPISSTTSFVRVIRNNIMNTEIGPLSTHFNNRVRTSLSGQGTPKKATAYAISRSTMKMPIFPKITKSVKIVGNPCAKSDPNWV